MSVSIIRTRLRASVCRDSLPDFIRYAWPLVEPATPLEWNWHHDVLCEVLTEVSAGNIKRLRVNIPPGTSKSLIVSVLWPAWDWTRMPWLRYLTASYSPILSIRDNRRLRSIVESDWYKEHFWGPSDEYPNGVSLSMDQSAKVKFETTAKGYRIATSVKGFFVGEHPNVIIIDDPIKETDAKSKVKRDECNGWYDGTVSTRRALDPAEVLIMQRLHLDDLSGHWDEKGIKCETLSLPMKFESKYKDKRDIRTTDGELLWPEKYDEEKVKEQEVILGAYGVAAQHQQRPIPEGGGEFERDWFQYVDHAPFDITSPVRGWDIAETDGGGNWTAGVKIGYSPSTRLYYIMHAAYVQSTLVDNFMMSVAVMDGPETRIREGAGSGKAVIRARSLLLAGFDYGSVPEKESKSARAAPFRSQCEMGNVRIVRGVWNERYLDVMCSFPYGSIDDDVDATSNAFNTLVDSMLIMTTKRKRKKIKGVWGSAASQVYEPFASMKYRK